MADILFSIFDQRLQSQRKALYPALLTDIIRAATDAIESLTLFKSLLDETPNDVQPKGFAAFDAHCGDTGCHLRAGMILEAFTLHHKMSRSASTGHQLDAFWIQENISALDHTRHRARQVCTQLTRDHVRPSKLGFDAKDTHTQRVMQILSWEEKNPVFLYSSDYRLQYHHDDLEFHSALDGRHPSFASTSTSSVHSFRSHSSATTSSDCETPSPLQTVWNLYDSKIMLRLIVFAYVLSKYKDFYCCEGTVAARLCPERAAEHGYCLLEGCWDFNNSEYKKARVQRIAQEFRALQVWLSDLSCSWLQSLAARYTRPTPMTELLLGTIQKSGTGLSAAPCYPGYLLLREELAKNHRTLVLVDRHFCSTGVHFNIFLADISFSENDQTSASRALQPISWRLRPTTLSELRYSSDQLYPHFIAMGNSIRGSTVDYKLRLASMAAVGVHTDDRCTENIDHRHEFLNSDHDRLALSFFARHRSYSFPLSEGKSERDFVNDAMHKAFPDILSQWQESSEGLETFGGGDGNMEIFGWQHVFLETKGRLAGGLSDLLGRGDLMPLSADMLGLHASES